jgi:glycosyltransferase involved in cell wall biosynthesis
MEKPKVTIGVCVRNGESTIADALESILAQNYSHKFIELLVVDDGSNDKTLSIIKKSVEKTDIPSKVFHHEWRGLGYSRNLVVDNAVGDYIIWVDGDMVLSRDYVRKQAEYLDCNPRVGLSLGFMLMPKDALLVRMDLLPFIMGRINFFKRGSSIKNAPTGGTAFRVEALRQVNGFDLNIKGAGEDVDVAFRMQKAGWLFGAVGAQFLERKGDIRTFGQYWRKHAWYGYGAHQVYLKDRKAIDPIRMNPLAGLLSGVIFAFEGYKLTRQKSLFFYLPVTFVFKRIAWAVGFNKSHSKFLLKN